MPVAQPVPTSHSPSRLTPARGSRSAQPNRAAPCRHAVTICRDENGTPLSGSFSGSLRIRSSTGSIPSSTASSSTATSSAKVPTASPGARMNVFASMFIRATSTFSAKLRAA